MPTKAWKITYYVLTILLSLLMLFSGYMNAIMAPEAIELFARLGYPAYLSFILGVAKMLGVIGIWQRKWPMLREWAYAGYFYDLFGAVLSFIAIGAAPAEYLPIVGMIVILVLGSYVSIRKAIGYTR